MGGLAHQISSMHAFLTGIRHTCLQRRHADGCCTISPEQELVPAEPGRVLRRTLIQGPAQAHGVAQDLAAVDGRLVTSNLLHEHQFFL